MAQKVFLTSRWVWNLTVPSLQFASKPSMWELCWLVMTLLKSLPFTGNDDVCAAFMHSCCFPNLLRRGAFSARTSNLNSNAHLFPRHYGINSFPSMSSQAALEQLVLTPLCHHSSLVCGSLFVWGWRYCPIASFLRGLWEEMLRARKSQERVGVVRRVGLCLNSHFLSFFLIPSPWFSAPPPDQPVFVWNVWEAFQTQNRLLKEIRASLSSWSWHEGQAVQPLR